MIYLRLAISKLTKPSVANEQGSLTTPSFVSFTDEERLIGESAKNQAAMNPVNTVFDVKYGGVATLGFPVKIEAKGSSGV